MTDTQKPQIPVAAPAAPQAAAAAGGSDPVTAIANVIGLALQVFGSERATQFTRDLTKIRKRRAEVKAEIKAEKAKYPKWDASRLRGLQDERELLDDQEDAVIQAAELEMMRAKSGK